MSVLVVSSCSGSGLAAGSARRTVASLTPTAVAIARRDAPPRRRARISATTAGLSREGPLGPRRPGTRAAIPSLAAAWSQRRSVSVLIPKPSATRTARAPLIAVSYTHLRAHETVLDL